MKISNYGSSFNCFNTLAVLNIFQIVYLVLFKLKNWPKVNNIIVTIAKINNDLPRGFGFDVYLM